MQIKFYYYGSVVKKVNCDVLVGKNDQILGFIQQKVAERCKRMTSCAIYDTETNLVRVATTICSPKDVFNKKVGKEICMRKLQEDEESLTFTAETRGAAFKQFMTYNRFYEQKFCL